METKTVIRDKSLRDIWAAADKSTIDILQDSRKLPQNIYSPNKTSPPTKQNNVSSWSQAYYLNRAKKENLKDVSDLFQPGNCNFEDDNISLHSIWTPTNNDKLKDEQESFYESPLIDLDVPDNLNTKQTDAYNLPEKYIHGTYASPLIDLDIPNKSCSNMFTSSEDYKSESPLIDLDIPDSLNTKQTNEINFPKKCSRGTYASPLIDLDIPQNNLEDYNCNSPLIENSYPKHKNGSTFHKDRTCKNIPSHGSRNNYINSDSDSEKSLDELNEETFGKFSFATNESELTLCDISEATAAYKLMENQSSQETTKTPRIFECSETLKNLREIQGKPSGAKPKTPITKVYNQNNMQQYYSSRDEKVNSDHKHARGRKDTFFSNYSHIKLKPDEILRLSQENLNIRKVCTSQDKFRKKYLNKQGPISASHTYETFHSKVSLNEQAGVATRTHETLHQKGNMSYYTAEKITYLRGEKLKNTSNHKNHENIVWKNISDFEYVDRDIIRNHDVKIEKYFPKDSAPQKDIGTFDLNKKTSYENYEPDTNAKYRFKNRNDSKRHELKKSNCMVQEQPSSVDKLRKCNLDERDAVLEDKSSDFKNNYSQRNNNNEFNDKKHNVIHFKVYNPKLHRPTKKKIIINNNPERMKLKNGFFNTSQTKDNGAPCAASKDFTNKEEKFDSEIDHNEYFEQTKGKSKDFFSSFDKPKNLKSRDLYTTSKDLETKNIQKKFKVLEEHNLELASKKNKTFVKDVLKDIKITDNNKTLKTSELLEYFPVTTKKDDKVHLKSALIGEGKEIADLIVGCERGLDMFKSFYNEWIELRQQSISLLEQIVTIINQSSRKNDTMKHVIAAINIAAGVANFIPHPGVALGAKVAGAVGGFFANLFKPTDNKKEVNTKKFEIREIFQRDIDSSSYAYIYGVQCGSQFQETCNTIRKFHNQLLEKNYQSTIDNDSLLEFMNEITEYNNSNTAVFYKRLQMCYERLIENSNSEDSRAFVRVFEDVPKAVSVISLLPWKFDSDGFDNSIVQNAWDELLPLFQDDNPATVDIINNKIHDCLYFLKKERNILSRNVADLFKETLK